MSRWPEVHWFGESWGAPICDPETHLPTPVGEACGYCGDEIREGDRGVVTVYVGGPTPTLASHHLCFCASILPIPIHRATEGGTLCGAETNECAKELAELSFKTTRAKIVTCPRCRELSLS